MLYKWKDYFGEIPHIYGIAAILDPGVNISGLRSFLDYYYSIVQLDYPYDVEMYVNTCRHYLEQLHEYYIQLYNPELLTSSSEPVKPKRFNPLIAGLLSKKPRTVGSSSSSSSILGVEDYLSRTFEIGNDFHILKWWRSKEKEFPMLARIAKDILAVPASTIASESAFSAGRRVLDEKRSRLAPESIQICVCKKDWDQAARRTQGLKADEEDDEADPFMMFDTDTSIGSDVPMQVGDDEDED